MQLQNTMKLNNHNTRVTSLRLLLPTVPWERLGWVGFKICKDHTSCRPSKQNTALGWCTVILERECTIRRFTHSPWLHPEGNRFKSYRSVAFSFLQTRFPDPSQTLPWNHDNRMGRDKQVNPQKTQTGLFFFIFYASRKWCGTKTNNDKQREGCWTLSVKTFVIKKSAVGSTNLY